MLSTGLVLTALAAFKFVSASPVLETRQSSVTTLTAAQIATFKPFSFYAATGYCAPSTTIAWSCGANCNANPNFKPIASGGDGASVQFWFVGFDPSLKSIIVSHQGTDTSQIEALLTDAEAVLGSLDSTQFPGVSSSVEVHIGFRNEQAKTSAAVLSAVQQGITQHGTSKVTVVGHSLGAALALIDGVFLPLHIPGIQLNVIGYGMPRVGNQAFANYVDAHLSGSLLARVNNKEDLVPILPGRSLGFHHPSGEKHIQDSNAWVACPGQDNTSTNCTTGDVPNIFEGDTNDHGGPYDGVVMKC